MSFAGGIPGISGIAHGGVTAAVPMKFADGHSRIMAISLWLPASCPCAIKLPLNTPLIAKGYKVGRKGRVAFARGELLDQNGVVLVEARGTYVDIPDEKLQEMNPETFGWRVSSDE